MMNLEKSVISLRNSSVGVSNADVYPDPSLPAPIDAINKLQEVLHGRPITDAQVDQETGDLLFEFAGEVKLEVFNFSGYEVWEIRSPDGTGEY